MKKRYRLYRRNGTFYCWDNETSRREKEMRSEGKLNDAEELLMQAVQRNPSIWRAARELGDFYKHEKRTSLALEYYAKASQLSPRKGKDPCIDLS